MLCVHLNIQFYKNNLAAGVHDIIIFPFSEEHGGTSNASFQLLIMLHADDITTSVTDTYYYDM